MKLHYFQDPSGNFGDDLNAWLWPRVAPGLLDEDGAEVLVGIGTLINNRLPPAPIKHVMGSGVGYGPLPHLDERFVFHAVRGYRSAHALGLPADSVISDGAVLLHGLPDLPAPVRRAKVSLVLTGESIANFDWAPVCAQAGIGMISCHEKVEDVLAAMRGSDLILADAMHGAIAADALRVPWVGVTCNENILAAKWQDWLSSLDLEYEPVHVRPLFDGSHRLTGSQRMKRVVKRTLAQVGLHQADERDRRVKSSPADIDRAVGDLIAATQSRPSLSEAAIVKRCVSRFQDRLQRLVSARQPACSASASSKT